MPFAPLWLGAGGQQPHDRWARRLRAPAVAAAGAGDVRARAAGGRRSARRPPPDRAGRSIVDPDRSVGVDVGARRAGGSAAGRGRARAPPRSSTGWRSADRALVASFAADAIAESGFESRRAAGCAARSRRSTPSEEPGDLAARAGVRAAVLRGRPRPTMMLVSDGASATRRGGHDLPATRRCASRRLAPVGRRAATTSASSRSRPGGARRSGRGGGGAGGAELSAAQVRRSRSTSPAGRRHRRARCSSSWRRASAGGTRAGQRVRARRAPAKPALVAATTIWRLDDRAFAVVPPLPRRRVLRVGRSPTSTSTARC